MFPTTQNSMTDLSASLANSKVNTTSAGSGSKAFIQFNYKDGSFVFGRDKLDITGERLVINTYSFTHGWVLWVKGSPKKITRSFVDDLPEPMPSVDQEHPSEARGVEARFMDDEETILSFETSSYGGRKGCDDLLNACKAKSGQGETRYLFPVVELSSESYKAKQGGTIHNPVFKVVDWMDMEGNVEGEAKHLEAPEPEPEAPVRRRRSA